MARKPKKSQSKGKRSAAKTRNLPGLYQPEEYAQLFFVLTVAVLAFTLAKPHFGADNAVYQSAYSDRAPAASLSVRSYVGLFDPYEALAFSGPQVAGVTVQAEDGDGSEFYRSLAATARSAEDFYNDAFVDPLFEATTQILDISEQVEPILEFYEPGVSAAWNAWLELMVDPEIN